MSEFATEDNEGNYVCPYCGHEHEYDAGGNSESLYEDGDTYTDEVECDNCGKEFEREIRLEVLYSYYQTTRKIKE